MRLHGALSAPLIGLLASACDLLEHGPTEPSEPAIQEQDARAAAKPPTTRLDAGATLLDAAQRPPHEPAACTLGDDEDGLSSGQERDAGFDPCRGDSDSDGCGDAREYFFGSCDPRANLYVDCSWSYDDFDGKLQFVAPARASGNWPRLMLRPDSRFGVYSERMVDGVRTPSHEPFLDVAPGTLLTFHVVPQEGALDERIPVLLVDESDQVLDRGAIVHLSLECPQVLII